MLESDGTPSESRTCNPLIPRDQAEQKIMSLHLGAGVAAEDSTLEYEVDVRYMGQGMTMPLRLGKGGLEKLKADGVAWLGGEFDAQHQKQFLFTIDKDREVVNFRAAAVAESAQVLPRKLAGGGKEPPAGALIGKQTVWMDHKEQQACFYDRAQLLAGNAIAGPAVITEMDSTTLVLSGCEGVVDGNGNIIISPVKEAAPASVASAGALSSVELELCYAMLCYAVLCCAMLCCRRAEHR